MNVFRFFESNKFTVSALICLMAGEKLCEGKDESSNAEESQLGFMSTQTPAQKHIIMHTDRPSQCLVYPQARDEMPDLANDHSVIHTYSQAAPHTRCKDTQAQECMKSQEPSCLPCISSVGNRDNRELSARARGKKKYFHWWFPWKQSPFSH